MAFAPRLSPLTLWRFGVGAQSCDLSKWVSPPRAPYFSRHPNVEWMGEGSRYWHFTYPTTSMSDCRLYAGPYMALRDSIVTQNLPKFSETTSHQIAKLQVVAFR